MTSEVVQTPYSRVFLIEDGAGPAHAPAYQGLGRAGGIDFGQGSITPIRKPSATQYGQFETIGKVRGAPDLPSITIESRMQPILSDFLRLVNKGCEVDLHVHIGTCANPEDFDGGWEKEIILESALPSGYSTDDLGALDVDQNAVVTETLPLSGERLYDVKKLRHSELAAAAVTDVVNKVVICDSKTCGSCGIASDGCQVMFALAGPTTGSPGVPSRLLYSDDGGSTWGSTSVSTLGLAEEGASLACVGTNLVVISADSNSLHYAPIADVLQGTETWSEMATGFVALKTPNAIFSQGTGRTWIVADGGYIYFASDPTSGVEVQSDGSASAQNLAAVHAFDANNAVAVGASNAVLTTSNGGASWGLVVGPAVGVALTAVFMRSITEWLVGTASGRLFYTQNSGGSWSEKAFPGSGAGAVRDLSFASRNVGYMAHDTATPRGRVLRTTNGGYSWVVMPEEQGFSVPTTTSILSVAACEDDVNTVIVGGTAANGTDGYVGKYS